MEQNKDGSYGFDTLAGKDKEFERLVKQATVLPGLELDLLRRHGLKDGMKVLDAACGPGVLSCLMAQNNDIEITGTDINPDLIKEAKAISEKQGLNIEFVTGDIYDLPYNEEFDFVYGRFLFQHLSNPVGAMRSIHKVLRPGGRLCIVDVDDSFLTIHPGTPAFDFICKEARSYQSKLGGDRFVGRKLRNYLIEAGYSDIKIIVETISSDQMGLEKFLDITTGFKKEFLIKAGSSLDCIDEVYALSRETDMLGLVGVFVVSGLK